MTTDVSAPRLAEVIRRRLRSSSCEVNVYWMKVTERRDDYAAILRQELVDDPVVVTVIRDQRFTNANAILNDLVDLITENRALCEERLGNACGPCAFVLLARTELAIAQSSSPVVLPSWFPMRGGTTVSTRMEDLTWSAEAPLGAARIGELCEGLLDIESALYSRISRVRSLDHRKTSAFLHLVRREQAETLDDILQAASQHLAGVTTPAGFRPSLRDGRALVARLWSVVQARQPEQLAQPSQAMASALDLPQTFDLEWYESLSSVLRRPSGGEPNVALRFCRNLLMSITTSCQLITAAAHEDDYGHYSVALIRSTSYDLRRSLADSEAVIRAL